MRGAGGGARIGNRRARCTTCNNFAQNVMRMTRRRLKELHEEEYAVIRLQVEADLYPQVIEDFISSHPRAAAAGDR
jgi:ribosomal protein L19E